MLKINEKAVYRLASKDKAPGLKVGGSWRSRSGDTEEWIAAEVQKSGHNKGDYPHE